MVGTLHLLLLALFAITCRASSPKVHQPSSALQAHALLRREENASAIPVVEPELPGVQSITSSNRSTPEDVGQERALLSRVHKRSSLQLKEDPEEEEDVVLDTKTGLPIPKECRHSFIRANFCEIKMWDSTYRLITGIRGNYRFQCDVDNPKNEGDVVQFPKFAVQDGVGVCSYERKLKRTGEIVPRWGVPVNRSCTVNCNGFRAFGLFTYMQPAVMYVECNQEEPKRKQAQVDPNAPQMNVQGDPNAPQAIQGGQAFSFFQEDPETGEVTEVTEIQPNLVARFSVDLTQSCELHKYVYLYFVCLIVLIGACATFCAMFRQWRKRYVGRDEDEWR